MNLATILSKGISNLTGVKFEDIQIYFDVITSVLGFNLNVSDKRKINEYINNRIWSR